MYLKIVQLGLQEAACKAIGLLLHERSFFACFRLFVIGGFCFFASVCCSVSCLALAVHGIVKAIAEACLEGADEGGK